MLGWHGLDIQFNRITPPLFEICVTPLWFYRRPAVVHVFTNRNMSEKEFCLHKKGREVKTSCLQCWFCSKLFQRQPYPHPSWPAPRGSFPRNQFITSASTPGLWTPELWTPVCEHLCFILTFLWASTSNTCRTVSEKPKKVISGDWRCSKNFIFKLIAIPSSFYVTSV